MEEKIIDAKFTKNKLALILLFVGIALISVGFIGVISAYSTGEGFYRYSQFPYTILYDSFGDFFKEIMSRPSGFREGENVYVIYIGVVGLLASLFFAWEMSRCALTVTNRRVTGKASFGKTVDLPLNQISAVGLGLFSRITVATSSGRIHFWFIKNRKEVHSALTDIIGKVQVEAAYKQNNVASTSNAEELKKYKDLLDNGVISQEEFDAKKKQLLGL